MLDILLAMIYGIMFFFLWWRIGMFLMKRFGDKGLGDELIVILWPIALALGIGLVYGVGKLIILIVERTL